MHIAMRICVEPPGSLDPTSVIRPQDVASIAGMRPRQFPQDKEKQIMNTSDSYSGDYERDAYQASGSGAGTPGYNAGDSGATGQTTGGDSYAGGTGYGQSSTYRSTQEIKDQAQA